jgi:MFS family permease
MVPLGIVLLVQEVRGSYAVAGGVTAAFALACAIGSPAWGRVIDRVGQPRVVAPTGTVSGLLVVAVALAAVGGAPTVVLLVLAGGAGLAFPPVTPAMRGAWRVVLEAEADRKAAYALDAVAVETLFVAGPVVLSLLLVVAPPAVPLLVTGALLAGGSLAYSATRAVRAWRPVPHVSGPEHRGPAPLRVPGAFLVFVVALAMAVGFGHLDVSMAAAARESLAEPSRVGLLFACVAGASAVGGLWYGSRRWVGPERLRLPPALAAFALGALLLTLFVGSGALRGRQTSLPALLVLLALLIGTGLAIAPGLIAQANLVDEYAPPDRLSEAQAWLNTAFTAGAAAGTALAGLLVDVGGPALSFLGVTISVAVATLGAVLGQRWWRVGSVPGTAPAGARG